jgi:hypothetical protein
LICNHNICDGCIKKKKTLKLQSYFCLKCILKENNQRCFECFNILKFTKKNPVAKNP